MEQVIQVRNLEIITYAKTACTKCFESLHVSLDLDKYVCPECQTQQELGSQKDQVIHYLPIQSQKKSVIRLCECPNLMSCEICRKHQCASCSSYYTEAWVQEFIDHDSSTISKFHYFRCYNCHTTY